MASVLVLVDDIFFQAKIVETAEQVGVDLRTCTTPAALATEMSNAPPCLVIVDLNARGNPLDAAGLVKASGAGVALIGYLSHVQTDLAASAAEAGFEEIMPRSQFSKNLVTILSRAKSKTQ